VKLERDLQKHIVAAREVSGITRDHIRMLSLDEIQVFDPVSACLFFKQAHVLMGHSLTFRAKKEKCLPRAL
jgi:hypothetical protein